MDIDVFSLSYKQMGIVATLELNDTSRENHTAWQRFLPNGPVAILPLSPNRSSLVWSTTPDDATRLLKLPGDEFVKELNEALVCFSQGDKNARV